MNRDARPPGHAQGSASPSTLPRLSSLAAVNSLDLEGPKPIGLQVLADRTPYLSQTYPGQTSVAPPAQFSFTVCSHTATCPAAAAAAALVTALE